MFGGVIEAIRSRRTGAHLPMLLMAFCCGFLLQAASARAETFTMTRGDRSFELYLDLPSDVRGEELGLLLSLFFEDWSPVVDQRDPQDYVSFMISAAVSFDSCSEAVTGTKEELTENDWTIDSTSTEILECAVLAHDDSGDKKAIRFFWHPECQCFVEVSAHYTENTAGLYRYIAQPVVISLREAYADHFSDASSASRLIADRDPSIPKDAIELGELQRQIGEAQRRSSELTKSRERLVENLRARVARKEEARKPKKDPNALSFELKNTTSSTVLVRIFNYGASQHPPAKGSWPGGSQAYILGPGSATYNLACRKGEHICYGAEFQHERSGSRKSYTYWGVSLDGNKGCIKCCASCGDGRVGANLIYKPSARPAETVRNDDTSGGSDGTAEALGTLLGVVGGAILNQRSGGGQPAPAPRGPNWNRSGISR